MSKNTKSLLEGYKLNFETLKQAFANGDVALMDCLDLRTRKPVAVLTAVGRDGDEYTMSPFAIMCEGNPYEYLQPPKVSGGYLTLEETKS